jgi:hypothetical protein
MAHAKGRPGARRRRRNPRRAAVIKTVFTVLAVGVGITVVVLVVMGFLRSSLPTSGGGSTPLAQSCPKVAPVIVGTMTVPAGPVAGYCQPQLENAAQVMRAAQSLGIGVHTQTIGVMTAIGESGLNNLDYGDQAGADSRGIFQQRDNGAWGTLADRMDPYTAAHNFFAKLVRIPNWKTLTPTQAAHAVQRNADPEYYTKYWVRAQEVVAALSIPTATPTP